MKKLSKFFILLVCLSHSLLFSTEFTISSYNCGGLSDHYDYLRAVSMQKIMEDRYIAEPAEMALNENIQKLALKLLFSTDDQVKSSLENEWNDNRYQQLIEKMTISSSEPNSPNHFWNQIVDTTITSYKVRPVSILDPEVELMLNTHISELTKGKEGKFSKLLEEARSTMAKRIFAHRLKFDIICLQEADYLDCSHFPENYEVLFSDSSHSVNGVAWNKDKFELIESLGSIRDRGFAIKLLEKESQKTILVASGHISGCNPYRIENDMFTGTNDSAKGDKELKAIIELFENSEADFKLIGMDSNVTSLHPRLNLLKKANYILDYENFIEPTCTNPNQVLNTRIDWIAIQEQDTLSITNIPVLGVGLNSLETNMSDHKPIAAKIFF